MTRFMLVLAMILVVGLTHAWAQSEAAAYVAAEVANELLLEGVDADWGTFAPGLTYVITPGGFKEPPGPDEASGDGAEVPGFTLTGNAGTQALVTFVLPAAFVSDDAAGNMPLSNWTFGWNYEPESPDVAFVDAGSVSGSALTVTLGPDGTGIYLGATVTVPTTAYVGTYTAQIIGSATYTGN